MLYGRLASSHVFHTCDKALFSFVCVCGAIREREIKRKTNGKRKQYNEIY